MFLTENEVTMKVFITQDDELTDISVEIHCREISTDVKKLEKFISNYEERIKGKFEGETIYIDVNDILYFESVDNTTFMYTEDKILTSTLRLYEIEERLSSKDFFRCSKSVVVNVGKIIKLKPELTRNIVATLCNDEIVVISRRYTAAFKKLLSLED